MTTAFNKATARLDEPSAAKRRTGMPLLLMFVVLVGFVIMFASIIYAVMYGSLANEGPMLMALPWGIVAMVDIYLGLLLFSFWVTWREKYSVAGLCWALFIIIFGNLVSCLYILKAWRESGGAIDKFWSGNRAAKSNENE